MILISIRRYVARFTSASYLPCATLCAYLKSFLWKWFIAMITDFVCTYIHHRQMVFIEYFQFICSWMIKYSLFTIYILYLVCFRYKEYTTYETIKNSSRLMDILKTSTINNITIISYYTLIIKKTNNICLFFRCYCLIETPEDIHPIT